MLTSYSFKINLNSSKLPSQQYDEYIFGPFKQLLYSCQCKCPECNNPLAIHSYYDRNFELLNGDYDILHILRVICKSCSKTHAILPKNIVPYSAISIEKQIKVARLLMEGYTPKEILSEGIVFEYGIIFQIRKKLTKLGWSQKLQSLKSEEIDRLLLRYKLTEQATLTTSIDSKEQEPSVCTSTPEKSNNSNDSTEATEATQSSQTTETSEQKENDSKSELESPPQRDRVPWATNKLITIIHYFKDHPSEAIKLCFKCLGEQFLQIRGFNFLICLNTT